MGKYLRFCLDSILVQTFEDIEILCIDDCSTDTTSDIIDEYCRKDSRILHISLKENRGVAVARNIGLETAKGKYIFFVDPDDFLPSKNALKTLYDYAVKEGVDEASGKCVCYDEGTQEFFLWRLDKTYYKKDILSKKLPSDYNLLFNSTVWNKLIKISFLKEHQIRFDDDLRRGQDTLFSRQFYSYLAKASRLDTVTYCRRLNNGGSPTYRNDARTPYYYLLLIAKFLRFMYSNDICKKNPQLFIDTIEVTLKYNVIFTALFESWVSFCEYMVYVRELLALYPFRCDFSPEMLQFTNLIMSKQLLLLWFRLMIKYKLWKFCIRLFFKSHLSVDTSHLKKLLDREIQSLHETGITFPDVPSGAATGLE